MPRMGGGCCVGGCEALPCCDCPASYNNCNFYVVSKKQPCMYASISKIQSKKFFMIFSFFIFIGFVARMSVPLSVKHLNLRVVRLFNNGMHLEQLF